LLHETDIARLTALRERRERLLTEDLAAGQQLEWTPMGDTRAEGLMVLDRTRQVGVIELREPIAEGQRVARHIVEGRIGGEWRELVRGTTIGYRRISAIAPVALEAVRVRVENAVEEPRPVEVRVFGG
jgi:alpha-L-fucosidase